MIIPTIKCDLFSKLGEKRLDIFLLESVFFLFLVVAYYVVSVLFTYSGFAFDLNISRIFFGLSVFFVFLILGYFIPSSFFYAIWHSLFIVIFLGQLVYYTFGSGFIAPLISNIIFLLVIFIFSFISFNIDKTKSNKILNIPVLFWGSLVLVIPSLVIYWENINLLNLLFIDVYKTRMGAREVHFPILQYINFFLARIVLPIIIVVSIFYKKRKYLIGAVALIAVIYLFTALKSLFFGLFSVLFFLYGSLEKKIFNLLILLLFFILLALCFYFFSENSFFLDTIIRRIFFIPPKLDQTYYPFFANDFTFWSQNPIGKLFTPYQYDGDLSLFIGEHVIGKKGLNANVGIITEGYFSFGYIGVIVHSLIIGTIFSFFNSLNISSKYFGIFFIFCFFINTSFITTLMTTHGLLFLIIFSYFILRNTSYNVS